ncbi:MAG: N-acetyltransferase [Desulfobacteraceae bacterium]|jgi:N-acetylglutamate synthase-like GNAT family acetyltransferase|nr:MAG: N-acetyltransferase [Desulfobacteraceae bacterium]
MIRKCDGRDLETIYSIINDAAKKYNGFIPKDRWKVPYMPLEELKHEIEGGVVFWGYERNGELIGVMGIQHVKDVTLIRHAYVRPSEQGKGVGSNLLSFLCKQATRPILIGTWADADWAVRFYENRGFGLVSPKDKNRLLKKYWSIPESQVQTSVVLADQVYFR